MKEIPTNDNMKFLNWTLDYQKYKKNTDYVECSCTQIMG